MSVLGEGCVLVTPHSHLFCSKSLRCRGKEDSEAALELGERQRVVVGCVTQILLKKKTDLSMILYF